MTIEEKATMIANQCRPCTDDFFLGIKQGVTIALNAEAANLEKAKNWDELKEEIAPFYTLKDEDDEDSEQYEAEGDLSLIGEIAAAALGYI